MPDNFVTHGERLLAGIGRLSSFNPQEYFISQPVPLTIKLWQSPFLDKLAYWESKAQSLDVPEIFTPDKKSQVKVIFWIDIDKGLSISVCILNLSYT